MRDVFIPLWWSCAAVLLLAYAGAASYLMGEGGERMARGEARRAAIAAALRGPEARERFAAAGAPLPADLEAEDKAARDGKVKERRAKAAAALEKAVGEEVRLLREERKTLVSPAAIDKLLDDEAEKAGRLLGKQLRGEKKYKDRAAADLSATEKGMVDDLKARARKERDAVAKAVPAADAAAIRAKAEAALDGGPAAVESAVRREREALAKGADRARGDAVADVGRKLAASPVRDEVLAKAHKWLDTPRYGRALVLVLATSSLGADAKAVGPQIEAFAKKHAKALDRDSVQLVGKTTLKRWSAGDSVKPAGGEDYPAAEFAKTFDRAWEARTRLLGDDAKNTMTILVWHSDANPNDAAGNEDTIDVPEGPVRLLWVRPPRGDKSKMSEWFGTKMKLVPDLDDLAPALGRALP